MRYRWTKSHDMNLVSIGLAVVAIAVGLAGEGWYDTAYIVAGASLFFFGASINKKAAVESEAPWREEVHAFSDGLSSFVPTWRALFRDFVNSRPSVTGITDNAEEMFKKAEWPDAADHPLQQWRPGSNIYSVFAYNFAVAVARGTHGALPSFQIDEWRRRTVRSMDVWGERVFHKVEGFIPFLERNAIQSDWAGFLKVLAYLEIGKAVQMQPTRKPALEAFWWLGKEWHK